MSVSIYDTDQYRKKLESVSTDILRNVKISKGFIIWILFLAVSFAVCLYAYSLQLRNGLGVTGLRDVTSWGMYIATFVFFVAASLIGMLISSVLGLIGSKWIKPIARIAEIIAVAFAAIAGLVIISDMGRPERLPYLFLHGRIQSPILWDVTVVTTYFFVSLMLWYLPMIPDLAVAKTRLEGRPRFLVKIYEILSVNWINHARQVKILRKAMRTLLILIIPLAFAIHTVTSWLFAVTPRTGWDSTIFGPYFISGAFVTGTAAVIIAMYFFRVSYRLEKYLSNEHFNKIGKILILVSVIYIYFNINEFLVPGYKLKTHEAIHLRDLFSGNYAWLFWGTQLGGLVIPVVVLLIRKMRRPLPIMLISVIIFTASWLKRYIIVIPPQEHSYLPVQNVPVEWIFYKPTLIEVLITLASMILVLIIITILSKLFPVIPITEMTEEIVISNEEALKK